MKIAIVDDEEHWRQKAGRVVYDFFGIDVPKIDCYVNGESFLAAGIYYDMVFLDIEMGRMNGLRTTALYKEKYPEIAVALLTSHGEYASKGYLVNAFRFIHKSRMDTEIAEALDAYRLQKEKEQTLMMNIVGLGAIPIFLKDIIYIRTEKRNVRVHTKTMDYISSNGIQALELELEPCGFFRSHKSFLINMSEIRCFDQRDIVMLDGSIVYLSARKFADFKLAYLKEMKKRSNK